MTPRTLIASAIPFIASIALAPPAQAAPQPNDITAECADGTVYTATAGSPMAASAHGTTPDGRPFTMSVKAAEDYPAFTGVPRRLLTRCDVYINEEFLADGYVLLTGPGLG